MCIAPQSHNDTPTYTVKLLLLGQSSVGKTSLVNRYTNHTFESNNLLTIGIEVKKIMKQMGGKKIRLQLWDTAGQQKYRTLPLQYYRGIQGILLVYDISNLSSFIRIEDWFSKVEQNCTIQKLVLALVGNKLDLQSKREVKIQTACDFAKEHNMKFKETSAKNATNVEQTIEEMMADIIERGLFESKKEKASISLVQQSGSRRQENDSCCG